MSHPLAPDSLSPDSLSLDSLRLVSATPADYPAVIDLVNLAFRGSGPTASWNAEAGILEGQRLTESLLREDLAAKPAAHLLLTRGQGSEPASGDALLGCVWLEPSADGAWYLGLLTVHPGRQKLHLGRRLLAAAEDFAAERGARQMRMTVLHVRQPLIGWYLRRGYTLTGETKPFPYGDERFGRPLCDDLYFVVLEKTVHPAAADA
jgi:ribosomal protein S18 acetylase RimI-like enzyme